MHGVTLEIEHVNPRARGGRDDDTNLVAACQACNRGKNDVLLSDLMLKGHGPSLRGAPIVGEAEEMQLYGVAMAQWAQRLVGQMTVEDALALVKATMLAEFYGMFATEYTPDPLDLWLWLEGYGMAEVLKVWEIVAKEFNAMPEAQRESESGLSDCCSRISEVLRQRNK